MICALRCLIFANGPVEALVGMPTGGVAMGVFKYKALLRAQCNVKFKCIATFYLGLGF